MLLLLLCRELDTLKRRNAKEVKALHIKETLKCDES